MEVFGFDWRIRRVLYYTNLKVSLEVLVRVGQSRSTRYRASKYCLVLRVGGQKGRGGKVILVYRHALQQFRVLKQKPKRHRTYHDGWDDEGDKQKALPLLQERKRIHTSHRDRKVEMFRKGGRDSEDE